MRYCRKLLCCLPNRITAILRPQTGSAANDQLLVAAIQCKWIVYDCQDGIKARIVVFDVASPGVKDADTAYWHRYARLARSSKKMHHLRRTSPMPPIVRPSDRKNGAGGLIICRLPLRPRESYTEITRQGHGCPRG